MDPSNVSLASAGGMVPGAYLLQGAVELSRRAGLVQELLRSKSLPEAGWGDAAIEAFVADLAAMDSNGSSNGVGAGEREGRVYSALVRRRHWGFAHGVGRSGDLTAAQPKAAGSSLLQALCNRLALHAARVCGLSRTRSVLVLPLATGMSLSLCLGALRAARGAGARHVIWPRCDQRSCLKSILTAGLVPCVVENALEGEELRTDLGALEAAIEACGGPEACCAVLTTTSCFAPRAPDRVVEVGRLCARLNIPHLVNHAYGLQASGLCGVLNEACRGWPPAPKHSTAQRPPPEEEAAGAAQGEGTFAAAAAAEGGGGGGATAPASRVDAWVSSTDKNFLVPVGGALVGSPSPAFIDAVAALYPGRASLSPILDLFITLLGMGRNGLVGLLAQRKAAFAALASSLEAVAGAVGERVLGSPHNPISMGLTLGALCSRGAAGGGLQGADASGADSAATYLGSMLFSRGVSGTRVVPRGKASKVEGIAFSGYGSHCSDYPHGPYLTAAAAIGMTVEDVALFSARLRKALAEFHRQGERG